MVVASEIIARGFLVDDIDMRHSQTPLWTEQQGKLAAGPNK
ncbi:MAG: hypothetical protein ACFFGZ_15130 [Candidatus Thorarchaeota archaeon]